MVKKIYPEDLDEDNELPEELLVVTPRKRKVLRLKKQSSDTALLRRENAIERRRERQSKTPYIWENS